MLCCNKVGVGETKKKQDDNQYQLYHYNNHSNYDSFDRNSIHYCYKMVTAKHYNIQNS